jgi:hypothetical protein
VTGRKPGPAKGHGGRPRKKSGKARKDGYKRVTVGPVGKGHQVYEHRAKAGLGNVKGSKGKGTVVDHIDGVRSHDAKSNLRKVSKKKNNANKHRKRYPNT